MNQEDKLKLVQGMFSGADLSGAQINVFVESGSKVVYKEVTSNKEEKTQATDEQIANAIRVINGDISQLYVFSFSSTNHSLCRFDESTFRIK